MTYNCDNCGKEFELTRKQRLGKAVNHYCSKSCESLAKTIDLTGKQFGKLTAVSKSDQRSKSNAPLWTCICECGSEKDVLTSCLISGNTRSCGCSRRTGDKFHGLTDTRIYRIWISMRQRCNNKNSSVYPQWGGRGITICEEWNDIRNFYAWAISSGYADNLSIERIDNDLGYYPDNCRWATMKEQLNNTSRSKKVSYNGKTQTVSQWAEELGISPTAMKYRIKANLPDEKKFFSGRIKSQRINLRVKSKEEKILSVWRGIKRRCLVPSDRDYKDYGGRGISICSEWMDKNIFLDWALNNGYEEFLSIDRIDNNGDYCPENCRWATREEQNNNKRDTKLFEYHGETMSIAQWSRRLGITSTAMASRLRGKKSEDEMFHVGKIENKQVKRALEYNKEIMSLSQWAKKLNISQGALAGRLRTQKPEERIFQPGRLRACDCKTKNLS